MSKQLDKIEDIIEKQLKEDSTQWGTYDLILDQVDKLEEQLAEKDERIAELEKQIKELSEEHFEMFGDMKNYKNLWLAEQRKNKQLRHQVCQEIKNALYMNFEYNDEYDLTLAESIIDQVEKGEKE